MEIDRAGALPELDSREMTAIGQQRLRAVEGLLVRQAGEFLDIGDAAVGVEEVSAVPAHMRSPSARQVEGGDGSGGRMAVRLERDEAVSRDTEIKHD